MTKTVLFAGGGTAGHVFPALAVARALVERGDWQPVFVGTRDRLEERLVPEAGFPLHLIDALPLPRRLSAGLFKVPFALRRAIRQVDGLIVEHAPVAVATFGGYVSFPVSRAAHKAGLPLVLHEQNAVPGLSNRFAARWAHRVALSFPASASHFGSATPTVVTGNPVRREILAIDREALRAEARARFDLDLHRPTVLVFGGSQGARSINRAVAGTARLWGGTDVQIIHAAGTKLHEETLVAWREEVGGDPEAGPTVRILDFIDDMSLAYAAADITVCRAGATSIAELTALGVPSVLVPYPAATRDHQLHNARALAGVGGAQVIEDHELTPTAVVDALRRWLDDPEALSAASERARAFGRRDAADLVAATIEDAVSSPTTAPGLAIDRRGRATATTLPGVDDEAFEQAFADSAPAAASATDELRAPATPDPVPDEPGGQADVGPDVEQDRPDDRPETP